jgi:hypothetical protein
MSLTSEIGTKRPRADDGDQFASTVSRQQLLATLTFDVDSIPESMLSGALYISPNSHVAPVCLCVAWAFGGQPASATVGYLSPTVFGTPAGAGDTITVSPAASSLNLNLMICSSKQPQALPILTQFEAQQFSSYKATLSSTTTFPQGIGYLQGSLVSAFLTQYPATWTRDTAIQGCYPRDASQEVVGFPLVISVESTNPSTVATDRTRLGVKRIISSYPLTNGGAWDAFVDATTTGMATFLPQTTSRQPLCSVSSVIAPPTTGVTFPWTSRQSIVVGRMPYHPYAAPSLTLLVAAPDIVGATAIGNRTILLRAVLLKMSMEPNNPLPVLTPYAIDFAVDAGTTQSVDLNWDYLNNVETESVAGGLAFDGRLSTAVAVVIYPIRPALLPSSYVFNFISATWSTTIPQEPKIGAIGFFRCLNRQLNVDVAIDALLTPAADIIPFLAGAAGPTNCRR